MTEIRVSPSELRTVARRVHVLADRLREIGIAVMQAARAAPSYDGQFGPQVEGLGAENQAVAFQQADRLESLSGRLLTYADEFERADEESVERLAGVSQLLADMLAKLNLRPVQAEHPFPEWLVNWYLQLGLLPGEAEVGAPESPWWAPIVVGGAEVWNRASEGARGMVGLGWYGLTRASQGSQDLLGLGWYGLHRASQGSADLLNLGVYVLYRASGASVYLLDQHKYLQDFTSVIDASVSDSLLRRSPAPHGPPTGVTGQVWVNGLDEASLLNSHQHQYDGTQTTQNDCATTSMSMVINQAFSILGYPDNLAQHGEMARLLDSAPGEIRTVFRFPEGFPGISFGPIQVQPEGAMPPLGAEAALNQFADEMQAAGFQRPWTVELQAQATPQDLVQSLQKGHPTIIFGVANGTPHAMVLAGYDGPRDTWSILDPGGPMGSTEPVRFREMTTAQLEGWWGEPYFAYQRNTMVTLVLDPPVSTTRLPAVTAPDPSTPVAE